MAERFAGTDRECSKSSKKKPRKRKSQGSHGRGTSDTPESRGGSQSATHDCRREKVSSPAEAQKEQQTRKDKHSAKAQKGDVKKASSSRSFREYLNEKLLKEGLQDGSLRSGVLRVNPKNYRESFIPEPGCLDIYLDGVIARNRALDGDLVAYRLLPKEEWRIFRRKLDVFKQNLDTAELVGSVTVAEKMATGARDVLEDKFLQRTAEVVAILEERHSRVAVGFLHKFGPKLAKFSPNDHRLPRLLVPLQQCPKDFSQQPSRYENTLFAVKITSWPVDHDYARGEILKQLGTEGEIEVETAGFLLSLAIHDQPFNDDIIACLPKMPFCIAAEEIAKRRDLRNEVTFTIDPDSARDMDDALHWKQTEDGLHEVGVHIADVSYFVQAGSSVDLEASRRATSIYLVDKVIPMLPHQLSNDLCSLCPNEDRLAVSIVWKMNDHAELLDQWIGRSVIHSKAKLSYRVAQEILDDPQRRWTADQLGTSKSMLRPVMDGIVALAKLTKSLNDQRVRNGYLRLRQSARLSFTLSDELLPIGCELPLSYGTQKLVEELMLLANISVAQLLAKKQPAVAFLRCHPAPDELALEEVGMFCRAVGVSIKCDSVMSLQATVDRLDDGTDIGKRRALVIANKLMTCLKPAQYYHFGMGKDGTAKPIRRHHALNIQLYTHFTSPIRRYADLIVHRQLLDSLRGSQWDAVVSHSLSAMCLRCNQIRMSARKAGELSSALYFSSFVKACGPLEEGAVVAEVLDQSFDVLVPKYNIICRVHCNSMPLTGWTFDAGTRCMEIKWQLETKALPADGIEALTLEDSSATAASSPSQNIQLFDAITVVIRAEARQGNPLSYAVYFKAPAGCSTNYGLAQNKN